MDYSKLSTEDLLALKAGDYSKVSTEGLMALKAQTVPTPKIPIPSDVVNEPGLVDRGVGGLTQSDLDNQANQLAESKFGQKNPKTAAAIGTGVGMTYDLASAGQGIADAPAMAKGISAIPTAVKDGMDAVKGSTLVKALTPGARSAVGAAKAGLEQGAITAENAAQGIVKQGVQRIATPTALGKRLGVPAGERNLQGIVDHFNEKFAAGVKPSVQDLVDLKSIIKQAESKGEVVWSDTSGALIAKANKAATKLLDASVKGRAALSAEYAKIAKVQNLLKKLGKGAGAAIIGTGAAATYKAIKG